MKNTEAKTLEYIEYPYPDYVNQLFDELSDEQREGIVKSAIFLNVEEIEPDNDYHRQNNYRYKISPLFRSLTNRVEILPFEEVINAIIITEIVLKWQIHEERQPLCRKT